ncbi:MAG TPA: adenylyl-sulfate kinase [Solirubrobacteraceae bacterium]|nr:adenylyl-sulfate kinase [Solirubrobacteraceae bacterium]
MSGRQAAGANPLPELLPRNVNIGETQERNDPAERSAQRCALSSEPLAAAQLQRIAAADNRNVRWQHSGLSRSERWQALESQGATVWLTGLPSSGKSTLGAALERRLVEEGRGAYLLDGDNLRHGICADLGFSREDRERNVTRVGELACLFADSGALALVALVSPYASARAAVRALHEAAGLTFIEVFVDTPLRTCVERDPKGLYAQALAGEIKEFTGIDDPYERPQAPDLVLRPQTALEDAVDQVLALLRRAQIGAAGPRGRQAIGAAYASGAPAQQRVATLR